MSVNDHHGELELNNAEDLDLKTTGIIMLYVIGCTAAFFVSVFAIYVYFMSEVAMEKERKVSNVKNPAYSAIKEKADSSYNSMKMKEAMQRAVKEQGK